MALKSSGFGGTNTLHELKGCTCDLCGKEADSEAAELVALDCSFPRCEPESSVFHQACLEKYLKSIKCERNRKIGFPCPRGCGKATKFTSPCPGKILKSHPISIRGEANKKRRQAELESLQRSSSNDKDSGNGAKSQKKDDKAGRKAESPEDKSKGKAAAVTKQASIKALHVSSSKLTPASSSSSMSTAQPAKSAAALKKEQLAAAARNLKNEIAARTGGVVKSSSILAPSSSAASMASHSSRTKEVKTLDEYLAERGSNSLERAMSSASGASAPAPVVGNAWANKSRVSSTSSITTDSLLQGESSQSALDSDAFPPPPAAAPTAAAAGRPPVPRSSSAASSTSAAPAVPAPAQPPAPKGAWAQKQPAVMSIVPPPPPPPRGAGAAAAASATLAQIQSPAAVKPQQEAEVQQAAAAPAAQLAQAKLSKSQRKNLRRAEKKAGGTSGRASLDGTADAPQASSASVPDPSAGAAAVNTPRSSNPASAAPSPLPLASSPEVEADTLGSPSAAQSSALSDTTSHVCAMPCHPPPPVYTSASPAALPVVESPPSCVDLLDRCLQLVVQHKLAKQVESLAAVGFPAGAALAAVQQHGGNLEAAVTFLLEQATGVCDSMSTLGLANGSASGSSGPLPEVDLSEELAVMQALQCRYGLAPGVLEAAVVECNGDLEATASMVAEQCGDTHSMSGSYGNSSVAMAGSDFLGGSSGSLFDGMSAAYSPHQSKPLAQQAGSWQWAGAPSSQLLDSSQGGAGAGLFSGDSGAYSAFSFGGFTEAALHAVHGPFASGAGLGGSSSSSLFGSLDNSSSMGALTPRHNQLGAIQGGGLGGSRTGMGLWGEAQPHSPPGGGLAAGDSPMYAAQMSGVRAQHQQLAVSPFDDHPHLTMSPPRAGYPGGLVADDRRSPVAGGLFGGSMGTQPGWQGPSLVSSPGVRGGEGYHSYQGPQPSMPQGPGAPHGGQYGRLEERELSDLMSALLCR